MPPPPPPINHLPLHHPTLSCQLSLAVAQVLLSPGSVAVTETFQNSSYTVQLDSAPMATVTVTLTVPPASVADVRVVPPVLVFTGLNYATPQTVVVVAIVDTVREGTEMHSVLHSSTSLDGRWGFAPALVAQPFAAWFQ
jgi:hypothetical protein